MTNFKQRMKLIYIACTFFLITTLGFGQTKKTLPAKTQPAKASPAKAVPSKFKLAYIFEDYIFENYSAVKKLDTDLKKKQETYQDSFNKMAIEYQTVYLDYQNSMKRLDSMTTEKLNEKLKKVQELKGVSENFQREAEKELQQSTGDGIQKIKLAIYEAAKAVAKEKGYGYVFTRNLADSPMTPNRVVLYAGDKGAGNISDAVLAKLGSPVIKK